MKSTMPVSLLVHMHNFSWRETVEERAAGGGVGTHVLRVDQFADFKVGQLLGQTDGVKGIARGTEDRANLSGAFLEAFQRVLAMVEDHAAVGVIDAVIEVVAELAAPDSFADYLGDGGGGRGDQEPPRLGEN